VSIKTPFWIALAARQCPNAARLGRIAGEGPFAVLSCKDGESRHVRLFLDQSDSNRAMWKMDRDGCGMGSDCQDDHRLLFIEEKENDTTNTNTTEATATVPA
jgi:hypothetical protein